MAKATRRRGKQKTAQMSYTMYLDQSAHLDWDWIQTFEENFQSYPASGWYTTGGVDQILTQAIENLAGDTTNSYHYTICEMGFLQRYIEAHPGAVATLQGFGDRFQALSGGITSPDCLVCSGEGFIRNYLVGQSWLKATLGMEPKLHCWLPDDFGQGPELPALLAALGFVSVSFSRAQNNVAAGLVANGLDFTWTASDGSSVYAHYMNPPGGYGVGIELENKALDEAVGDFINYYGGPVFPAAPTPPYSGAASPYMYIPIDIDFCMPVPGDLGGPGLLALIGQWNGSSGPAQTGVTLKAGTYDQFAKAMIAAGPPRPLAFNGTPYWTGYYASRPELKILHYQCVRALTAAEIFGLLAARAQAPLPASFWSDVDSAWSSFAPSTHHDYICGTAIDTVYHGEQLPLLQKATTGQTPPGAVALRASALAALAAVSGPGGGVLIGNSLSFQRFEVAELDGPPGGQSFVIGGLAFPVQATADGNSLLFAQAPSLGAAGGAWSSAPPTSGPVAPTVTENPDGTFSLANENLTAIIATTGMLLGLIDAFSGADLLAPPGPDTDLGFYNDMGGIYRFGNEHGWTFGRDASVTLTPVGAAATESGPLRASLSIQVQAVVQGKTYTYQRSYALMAQDPFLRVTLSGRAPPCYSVMATIPFASPPVAIDHGTAGHWTSIQPANDPVTGAPFWAGPVFRPTHDFVLPRNQAGAYVGAVYHGGIPAWAIDDNGYLIGCVLRDTPSDDNLGAYGSDPDVHVQSYALRVPSRLSGPATGQPLQEARSFTTPLEATPIPASAAPPSVYGVAEVGGPAMITVAKPGTYDPTSLILRLQQPTNAPLTVTMLPGGSQPTAANLLNAAEGPWTGAGSAGPGAGGSVVVQMTGALATVEIPGLGLPPGAADTEENGG